MPLESVIERVIRYGWRRIAVPAMSMPLPILKNVLSRQPPNHRYRRGGVRPPRRWPQNRKNGRANPPAAFAAEPAPTECCYTVGVNPAFYSIVQQFGRCTQRPYNVNIIANINRTFERVINNASFNNAGEPLQCQNNCHEGGYEAL
jgi:hypothetical protein